MFHVYILNVYATCCMPQYNGNVLPNCSISKNNAELTNKHYILWNANVSAPSTLYHNKMPVSTICKTDKFGMHNSESKLICNASVLFEHAKNCTIISIGSENKWDFEQEMFDKTTCKIETFDCTGVGLGWEVPARIKSRVRLHLICLGNPEWRYLDLPNGGKGHLYPKRDKQYSSMTWVEMLKYVNLPLHVAPTYLKIDCEGCELDLFHEVLQTNTHNLLPDQISVEMHYPYDSNEHSIWNKRFNDLSRVYHPTILANDMHNIAGFSIIDHIYNKQAQCCQEILFARTKCISKNMNKYLSTYKVCNKHSNWNNIESLIKISLDPTEDQLLLDWITGYIENIPCFHRLHVISSDVELSREKFKDVPNVTHHLNNYPAVLDKESSYLKMQWHVTWADNYTTSEFVLFWDVDSIPVLPIRYDHYFNSSNVPYWYYWTNTQKSWIDVDNEVIKKSVFAGYGNVNAWKNIKSQHNMDFMTFFPIVIPRVALPIMRNVVIASTKNARYYDNAWRIIKHPSHVDLIGKSIMITSPSLIDVVHCPPMAKHATKCKNLYRTVEHAKHPIQGAHSNPSHYDYGKAHKYIQKLRTDRMNYVTKNIVPHTMWHYRREIV